MRLGLIQWWHEEVLFVGDLFMLSDAQMRRIEPYFPLSHGIPRVDDRIMIDATHLKAHRTAASLLKGGLAAIIPQIISLRSPMYRAHQSLP